MDRPEKKREKYLNEDLSPSDLSEPTRQSFERNPKKTLYPAGTRFYRLGTHFQQNGKHKGNPTMEGAFWLPEKEYLRLRTEARERGRSMTDVSRRSYAIKPDWNPEMDNVTEIRLKKPVYGFEGVTARQVIARGESEATQHRKKTLKGGAVQVFLPGLDQDRGRNVKSKEAMEKLPGPSGPHADILTYQPDIDSKLAPRARRKSATGSVTPKPERDALFQKLTELDERRRKRGQRQ